jgi:transforming growth factor-beta-induced protein
MRKINILTCALTVALVALASCTDDFKEVPTASGRTIVEIAATNDNFNILAAALTKTGLVNSLNNNNSGSFTVFAPSDAAFVSYWNAMKGPGHNEQSVLDSVNRLRATNPASFPSTYPTIATVTGILNYHIVNSTIASSQITGGQAFSSLGTIQINNVLPGVNVTYPTRLSISKQASVLINAGRAVENSPANGAIVTTVDAAFASNGVIHTIDRVLIPITAGGSMTVAAVLGLTVNYATNPPTIGGGTTSNDTNGSNYNLLAAALRVTGLAPAILPNANPLPDFTVFAPTDAAFVSFLLNGAAYSAANETAAYNAINGLSASTTPTLAQVTELLKYHVVAGRVLSTDLTNGQTVSTLQTIGGNPNTFNIGINGSTFTLVDKGPAVTDPTISGANILTNAGVIHQINGILRNQ